MHLFKHISRIACLSAILTLSVYADNSLSGNMLNALQQVNDFNYKTALLRTALPQSLSPEEIATVQLYKPFINYLNSNQISEDARVTIFNEALKKCQGKVTLSSVCANAYAVMGDNTLMPGFQMPVGLQKEMSNALLQQAARATDSSFKALVKNGVTIGFILGVVNFMERMIGDSFSKVVKVLPNVSAFVNRMATKGYNKLAKRPDALNPDEILVWEQTFEGLLSSLCEQNTSSNLMLKNLRIQDENQDASVPADPNWAYFSELVHDMCGHVTDYLQKHMPHYTGGNTQRKYLVSIANGVIAENKASISFLMNCIIKNLNNIKEVCRKTEHVDDLDVVHIKKLGRITLLLFKKLRIMLHGGKQGSAQSGAGAVTEH